MRITLTWSTVCIFGDGRNRLCGWLPVRADMEEGYLIIDAFKLGKRSGYTSGLLCIMSYAQVRL